MRATELYKAMRLDKSLDTYAHLDWFNALGASNETILEIGVHCGVSTTAFLSGMEMVDSGHLYSVDVHPSCRYVHYGHPQWTFFCTWAGDKVEVPELDVLYVDGNHEYTAVLHDLETYSPKVKQGGLILCHDANSPSFPGVRTAIEDFCGWRKLKHELRPESNGLEVIYV